MALRTDAENIEQANEVAAEKALEKSGEKCQAHEKHSCHHCPCEDDDDDDEDDDEHHHHHHEHGEEDDDDEEEEEGSLKKIILVAIIFIVALLLDKLPFFSFNGPIAKGNADIFLAIRAVYLALYAIAYLKCGREVLHGMIRNIAKGNFFTEETLMGISTIGALILGEYSEAVAVMLLFELGEFLEDKAVDSAKHSITKLVNIRADKACVIRNGKEETVDAAEVRIGEIITVRPGERVPLDGKIVQGTTLADTSALTGESVPRELLQGDDILSGFISTSGQVQVEVTKLLGESSASRIIQMVKDAQKKKSHTQKFVSRIAKVYTPFVCALALLVAIAPPLVSFFITGINSSAVWKVWVYRALELLVVSCPCALVISVPLTFFAGIGRAGKSGILIKGANYLEQLSKAKTVVFDKTGTLTKGTFAVSAIHPADESKMNADELLAIATHTEYYSNHPISRSLRNAHSCPLCKTITVNDTQEITGHGIKCTIEGSQVLVGNSALMQREKVQGLVPCQKEGCGEGTIVHVAKDGIYCGHIIISDVEKEDAKKTVSMLRKTGVKKTVMLTGDSENVAASLAKKTGIDKYYAELLPQDKVLKLEELLKDEGVLLFVGDGINDAPVLTRADVGIAMGAMGSDAAIEAADVVLMDDKPSKTALAISHSKWTMGIVWQNIFGSLGIKAAIIVLALLGIANMWTAVFGDV
ncbi:MAG: cadmium-translocating P-type ATPase, partial [Treponema sp.]|nr:cadmium-translocating P-type ATPase [Treponema sp.]